ncbi:acetylcholinesterase, putative [Ixodes scapularis]|uniref:Acetylcholinesterase, putative n=1 Tax=Ixodes scapularis TaxID=6945 RepID=B7PY96_IXOSC|nr:acetylcholinesterase, putative [Ixodes scapularis]|eukprot:XP_002402741.1 acetylcholinesterase, putative [Ixodes scapularis]
MASRLFVLQTLVLVSVAPVRAEVEAPPEVRTSSGSLVGMRLRSESGGIDAYYGIPFAESPIGERRFKKPVPVSPWRGVFQANRMHPGCVQTNFSIVEGAQFDMSNTDEDCLRLNIWAPKRTCRGDGAACGGLLPVFSRLKWLKGLIDGPTVIRAFLQSFYNIRPAQSAPLADAYFSQTEGQEETEVLMTLSTVVSDLGFNCATDVFADAANDKNVSVFRYLFGHRPSFSFWENWITVTHNEELPFLLGTVRTAGTALKTKYGESFAAVLKDLKPNLEELRFSDELIHTVAEFCRTGKPKIPKTDQDWPKYTKEDKAYVILKPNDYSVAHGPRSKKCHLWEPYLVKRYQ